MTFALHPQLAADTHRVGEWPLCRLLLMNNAHFPWLILVPQRTALRELFELAPGDYAIAMQEIRLASEKLAAHTGAHKMNIGALGNMVPQLHIHVIARFEQDAAWPNPVWNSGVVPRPYTAAEAQKKTAELRELFALA